MLGRERRHCEGRDCFLREFGKFLGFYISRNCFEEKKGWKRDGFIPRSDSGDYLRNVVCFFSTTWVWAQEVFFF